MKKEYKVRLVMGEGYFLPKVYEVICTTTIFGERTTAYDSDPDEVEEESVFQGGLSDCDSYIRLTEKGYMI
jgi:hypothetical protein